MKNFACARQKYINLKNFSNDSRFYYTLSSIFLIAMLHRLHRDVMVTYIAMEITFYRDEKNGCPQTSKFAKHSKKSAHPIVLLFILYHQSVHTLLPTNLYPTVVGTIPCHKIQPMFLHLSTALIFFFFITFILSICLNNFNSQIFLSRRRLFYFSFFPKISFVFFCFF